MVEGIALLFRDFSFLTIIYYRGKMGKHASDGSETSEGSEAKEGGDNVLVGVMSVEPRLYAKEIFDKGDVYNPLPNPMNVFNF